ncbi:hypothetical protein HCH_01983 [Hahella chejuensis KCTC 2396]|uniref:Uncharacterized protein n=1 Tax=Hahella chejuensis (strain KCTC 2396) TaxID=349521 RepID=Q2SKK8_HAHCH|nr:hypothetical protein HCH_01983 [Hahella chejuensis KCTC 2396]
MAEFLRRAPKGETFFTAGNVERIYIFHRKLQHFFNKPEPTLTKINLAIF